MKRIIAMLAIGTLMSGATYAQETSQKERTHRTEHSHKYKAKKSPEEMAAKRTEMFNKKYDLNKSQQRRLQALNLKFVREKHELHKNRGEARDHRSMHGEMQASRARYEAELRDILNKKQYAQYEADKTEKRAKRERRKGKRGERQHRNER